MGESSWRMTRQELREILEKYEKAVDDDSWYLTRPSKRERQLLGKDLMSQRADAIKNARETNRKFVEVVMQDLPESSSEAAPPSRPVAEVRCLSSNPGVLPTSSYGSLASVFLHLFRDWTAECDHVIKTTYEPAIAELKRLLPQGGEVLLPGAGLGRFAVEVAKQGYKVEANDASRLFLTFADYLLNRPPSAGLDLLPLAHVFSENWSYDQQYLKVTVPSPAPTELAALARAKEGNSSKAAITLVAGDFIKNYGYGCAGYRKFDAVVTSFFIDTSTDIAEVMDTIDGLLEVGGVWVNVGPLNWKKEARLKLTWTEVKTMWQNLGYEFVSQESLDVDYHLKRSLKMYTESYYCSLTAAVKRRSTED